MGNGPDVLVSLINDNALFTVLGWPIEPEGYKVSSLQELVSRTFLPGGFVTNSEIGGFLSWGRAGVLLEKAAGDTRYVGHDWIVYGDPTVFWPPPLALTSHENASAAWEFEAEDLTEVNAQELMGKLALEWPTVTVFRQLSAKGAWLPNHYVIRACGKNKGKSDSIGTAFDCTLTSWKEGKEKINVKWAPRCALCSRSSPLWPNHGHQKCSIMTAMNKVRDKMELLPVLVKKNGVVDLELRKRPLDVEAEVRELRRKVAGMQLDIKRLGDVLVPYKGPVQSAQTAKKRQAEAAPAESSEPPKKKRKRRGRKGKDKKKDGGGGGPKNGGSGGKPKGSTA